MFLKLRMVYVTKHQCNWGKHGRRENIKKGCLFHGLNLNSKLFFIAIGFFLQNFVCFKDVWHFQIATTNTYRTFARAMFINHRANHINSRWSDKRPSTFYVLSFSLLLSLSLSSSLYTYLFRMDICYYFVLCRL